MDNKINASFSLNIFYEKELISDLIHCSLLPILNENDLDYLLTLSNVQGRNINLNIRTNSLSEIKAKLAEKLKSFFADKSFPRSSHTDTSKLFMDFPRNSFYFDNEWSEKSLESAKDVWLAQEFKLITSPIILNYLCSEDIGEESIFSLSITFQLTLLAVFSPDLDIAIVELKGLISVAERQLSVRDKTIIDCQSFKIVEENVDVLVSLTNSIWIDHEHGQHVSWTNEFINNCKSKLSAASIHEKFFMLCTQLYSQLGIRHKGTLLLSLNIIYVNLIKTKNIINNN